MDFDEILWMNSFWDASNVWDPYPGYSLIQIIGVAVRCPMNLLYGYYLSQKRVYDFTWHLFVCLLATLRNNYWLDVMKILLEKYVFGQGSHREILEVIQFWI